MKTRGIRLKDHLDPEDQGQRKLIQVTYSQLIALGQTTSETPSDDTPPQPPITPRRETSTPSNARRRAIARMLRVELEATLTLLDQALENVAPKARAEPAEQPEAGSNA